MIVEKDNFEKDIHLLLSDTVKELVVRFNKPASEAEWLVEKSDMKNIIAEKPIALHDSAYKWATKLLTENGDIETLERYLV